MARDSSAEFHLESVVPSGALSTAIVQFCRVLRDHGFQTSPVSTIDAMEALTVIDLLDRSLVKSALALSLIKRPQDRALFALLFEQYWRFDVPDDGSEILDDGIDKANATEQDNEAPTMDEDLVDKILQGFSYESFWQEHPTEPDKFELDDDAYRDSETDYQAEFNGASNSQELQRLARALQAEFSLRNGRRRSKAKNGRTLDFRRSIRHSVHFGGTPIELVWQRNKPVQPKLILFVDVSRSMASYAKLLIQFATVVLRHALAVELFLFATDIKRISSQQLGDSEFDIDQIIADCGGGTRIGNNLKQCLEDYPQTLMGSRNVALILSDGLDSGDAEELALAMEKLKTRTRRILWLNPMLGIQSFEQATREMSVALPYIDTLAPANDMESLWQLLGLIKGNTSLSIVNR